VAKINVLSIPSRTTQGGLILNNTADKLEVPALNTRVVTTGNDVTFCARLVFKGDRYGLESGLTYDKDEPLLEFYDMKYPHTPYGQFVSRYYVQTLFESNSQFGINLDGGVPRWSLDATALKEVLTWVKTIVKPKPAPHLFWKHAS
jgi:hypothetical protein